MYDVMNHQTAVYHKDMNQANHRGPIISQYFYDGEGERIGKEDYDASGYPSTYTQYLRSGGAVLWEETWQLPAMDSASGKTYVYAGGRMAVVSEFTQKTSGAWDQSFEYFATDHLGTVRFGYKVDASGTLIASSTHDYEPFGLEIGPVETSDNTHRFTGHERDAETGNDYMHYRFYGASMGRFAKPDSNFDGAAKNPQGWNLYSYVHGNPVNFNDPTGHMGGIAGRHGDTTDPVGDGVLLDDQIPLGTAIGSFEEGTYDFRASYGLVYRAQIVPGDGGGSGADTSNQITEAQIEAALKEIREVLGVPDSYTIKVDNWGGAMSTEDRNGNVTMWLSRSDIISWIQNPGSVFASYIVADVLHECGHRVFHHAGGGMSPPHLELVANIWGVNRLNGLGLLHSPLASTLISWTIKSFYDAKNEGFLTSLQLQRLFYKVPSFVRTAFGGHWDMQQLRVTWSTAEYPENEMRRLTPYSAMRILQESSSSGQ